MTIHSRLVGHTRRTASVELGTVPSDNDAPPLPSHSSAHLPHWKNSSFLLASCPGVSGCRRHCRRSLDRRSAVVPLTCPSTWRRQGRSTAGVRLACPRQFEVRTPTPTRSDSREHLERPAPRPRLGPQYGANTPTAVANQCTRHLGRPVAEQLEDGESDPFVQKGEATAVALSRPTQSPHHPVG